MTLKRFATARRLARYGAAAVMLAGISGCATVREYIPSIPPPSFGWLWSDKKPGPLPELAASVTTRVAWQAPVGKAGPGFAPAVFADAIYAASLDGTIVRVEPGSGRIIWRINANRRLSAGVGADANVIVVGTDKGDILAFDTNGKQLWTARVSTEVIAPPRVADGLVIVFSGDGNIHALSATDGTRKWVYQRVSPPLTVRNYAGGTVARGAVFVGTAGGRLLAIDVKTGIMGWDATVASPRGATELERIADVTSLPTLDGALACAVAYQGRLACFDLARGTLNWSRDVSSLYGMVADDKHLYVTDERGAVHALDKTTGASVWKQDKLAARKPGGPQLIGEHVIVVDVQGFLHVLAKVNGAYVGRVATDGAAATSQPLALAGNALWLSAGGALFAVTVQ